MLHLSAEFTFMESKIFRKLFSLHQIAAGSSGKIILLRMSLVNLGLLRTGSTRGLSGSEVSQCR